MTTPLSEQKRNARIAKFRSEFIASPFLRSVMSELDECRQLSKLGGEPECILVTGDTGAGKTSLINKYLELNSRKRTYEGTSVPVLSTTLPGAANSVLLFQQILADLKHPFPFESTNEVELRKKIKTLLHNCQVELIIIDEFQHLIERKNLNILAETANSIKSLIVDTKVPMALFGMPYSSVIMDKVSQLTSRFERRRDLCPFRLSNAEDIKTYRTFLFMLEDAMDLPEQSDLASEEMAFRLYAYSSGNFRKLKNLLNDAFTSVLISGESLVNKKTLSVSAIKLDRNVTRANNPFSQGIDKVVALEPDQYVGWDDYKSSNNTNMKSKSGYKKLTLSEIF